MTHSPTHQPIHLARTLTTLDVLSDGRLDAGFGLGWMRDEYDALGLPWSSRGQRFDDILSFLHTWWTINPIAYESPFISLPPSRVDLRPIQPGGPPIFLGGSSPLALARVGRRADGWIGFDTIPEETAMSFWSTARRAAEESGRDPDALKKIIRVNGVHGESLAHLADRLARFAEQGADEAVVDFVFTYPTIDERLDAADRLMHMAPGESAEAIGERPVPKLLIPSRIDRRHLYVADPSSRQSLRRRHGLAAPVGGHAVVGN